MRRLTLAALLFAPMLCSCDVRPEWSGRIYPDKSATKQYEDIGPYWSLDECRGNAKEKIAGLPSPSDANYLCSYKCRWDESSQQEICKTDGI
jgi:hypothetical protein